MHLSDTLVIGPLYPLLRQPVRVRLGALLVGLVGGLGILTLAGLVLVLVPAALPASARSLVPGWALPAEPSARSGDFGGNDESKRRSGAEACMDQPSGSSTDPIRQCHLYLH